MFVRSVLIRRFGTAFELRQRFLWNTEKRKGAAYRVAPFISLVEQTGIEPATSRVRFWRSPS